MEAIYRNAETADLQALVRLLSDDILGANREDSSQALNPRYREALAQIDQDPNNELLVVEVTGKVAGMLQLTYIPYLTHIGSRRCLIEGVRIDAAYRGQGLGEQMIRWAIGRAREKACSMVQLTSDKTRTEALRFYEKLGFKPTHIGFKLHIGEDSAASVSEG